MEFSIETLLSVVGLLLGGGGVGTFFTWRYLRQQEAAKAKEAEANAVTAETTAVKEVQDVYQQLITDVKSDRDEQRQYITELKDDRRRLREERDELVNRIDATDARVRELQEKVLANSETMKQVVPLLCGCVVCPKRVPVVVSDEGEVKPSKLKKNAGV